MRRIHAQPSWWMPRKISGASRFQSKLMLEASSHPMVLAEEVVRMRYVFDLQGDEELQSKELYLLFSVERIGSRLSNRQMAVIVRAVEGGRRKGKKGYGSGN